MQRLVLTLTLTLTLTLNVNAKTSPNKLVKIGEWESDVERECGNSDPR